MDSKDDEDEPDDDEEDEEDGYGDGGMGKPLDTDIGDINALLTKNKDKNNMNFIVTKWQPGAARNFRPLDNANKELFPKGSQFNRFISIVDLRDEVKDNDGNNLYLFEPQKGAKKLHKNPSALNFFHNSKQSVIPNPDADPNDEENELETQKLTAVSTGPQITLSFHVESEESVRCYFYINGQCTRFMPADLKMLLPLFFEDSKENREFANSDEIMRWIKGMEDKLKDIAFMKFLEKYGVKGPKL